LLSYRNWSGEANAFATSSSFSSIAEHGNLSPRCFCHLAQASFLLFASIPCFPEVIKLSKASRKLFFLVGDAYLSNKFSVLSVVGLLHSYFAHVCLVSSIDF
jgi:hypothetical protein